MKPFEHQEDLIEDVKVADAYQSMFAGIDSNRICSFDGSGGGPLTIEMVQDFMDALYESDRPRRIYETRRNRAVLYHNFWLAVVTTANRGS